MNYYQHHIGDYAAATAYLSLIEDAIYTRLLRVYYRDEKPLPADTKAVAWLIGLRSKKEVALLENLLPQFFILQDDGWHNSRADEEIAQYRSNKEAAQENGKKGGRPKTRGEPSDNPDETKGKPEDNPDETQVKPRDNPDETQVKPRDNPDETQQKPNPNPEITQRKANQEPITNNQRTTEHPPTPLKRGVSFDAAHIPLPDWIDPNDWQAWIADRKARKKPVTQEGAKRQIQQLENYRRQGHDPADVITNSIACGYQGLFPPRPAARASPPSRAQQLADWNAELTRELQSQRPTVIDMGVIHATQ